MFSRSTKPSTASSLIALLFLLTPALSSRIPSFDHERLVCLGTNRIGLAADVGCGDKGSLAYCLGNLQTVRWAEVSEQIRTCLVNAGCAESEADIETVRTLSRCEPTNDDLPDDLRKRQDGVAKAIPQLALAAAAAATTTPPTAATAVATTTTAAALAARDGGLAHSGRPLVCFTTSLQSTTSCPLQSTGSRSGSPLSCFPTTVPTSVCADGLICDLDANGSPSCMYADNRFGTAGVVIAIFFAVATTAALALIVTLCCRERREQRRLERAAEAAAIAKETALLAGSGGGGGRAATRQRTAMGGGGRAAAEDVVPPLPAMAEDRRPLVPGRGAGEEAEGAYAGYEGHAGGVQDANPFGDQNRFR